MDRRISALSLVVLACLLVLETSAQNFYPLRYGKRDGSGVDGRFLKSTKYNRRSDANGNEDLFYGSRYGKRSYNATPAALPVEPASGRTIGRYGRSPGAEATDRNDKFYFGSRFGKRNERSGAAGGGGGERGGFIVCRFTGFRRFYDCLPRTELPDSVF